MFEQDVREGTYQMDNMEGLSIRLADNLTKLYEKFSECPDVIFKNVLLKDEKQGCIIFISGLIDVDVVQRDFLKPVLNINYMDLINENIIKQLPLFRVSSYYDFNLIVSGIMAGETILLVEGSSFAISADIKKLEKRNIKEPDIEKNVRGPHEGFIEIMDVNISILRRKLQDNNLKFKTFKIGNVSKQNVAVAYIEGIANPSILNTLCDKIKNIGIDNLIVTGFIEQLIADSKYSVFPQYLSTERPERTVSALLEGRLVILLDGDPTVLIAPVSFFAFLKSLDDYSTHWINGTFIGMVRLLAAIITITLPALYISLTSFNYYMIPIKLLLQLAQSRSQVPFNPVVEAFIMEITIEMIKEGSIRMPTYIGTTIGVVGGVIIGQAAVQAGIVSSLFIIVIGVTLIASFVIPDYNFVTGIRLLRIVYMLISSLFGIIGLAVCNLLILIHLLSLESLGQPYFQPILPFKLKDIKDTIIRLPLKYFVTRPDIAKPLDKERNK